MDDSIDPKSANQTCITHVGIYLPTYRKYLVDDFQNAHGAQKLLLGPEGSAIYLQCRRLVISIMGKLVPTSCAFVQVLSIQQN